MYYWEAVAYNHSTPKHYTINPVLALPQLFMRLLYCSGVWSYVVGAISTPTFIIIPLITIWFGIFPIVISWWAALGLTIYMVATHSVSRQSSCCRGALLNMKSLRAAIAPKTCEKITSNCFIINRDELLHTHFGSMLRLWPPCPLEALNARL